METESIIWKDTKRIAIGLPLTFTHYSLTNTRFFVSSGIFSKTEDEVRLYRIMDISLKRSFLQRIFGLGTIECCSADKTLKDFEIKNIKNPKAVKEMLSEMVEKERDRKKVTNREFMTHDDDTDSLDDNIM